MATSRINCDNAMSADEYRQRKGLGPVQSATPARAIKSRSNPALKPHASSHDTRRPWIDGLLVIPPFKGEFGPEDTISAGLRDRLYQAEVEGRCRAVWTHVPNEGDRGRAYRAKLAAMGVVWSTADWSFMWAGGSGCIELKRPQGRKDPVSLLTEGQALHRAWCLHHGVRHAVCTSVEEAWETLVEWGAVIDG